MLPVNQTVIHPPSSPPDEVGLSKIEMSLNLAARQSIHTDSCKTKGVGNAAHFALSSFLMTREEWLSTRDYSYPLACSQ